MSEDFEGRLAAVEGAHVRVRQIVSDLYADYASIKRTLENAEGEIAAARKAEKDAARAVVVARREYEEEEAALLSTDKRAQGSNADERKRNAASLIATERKPGGKLYQLWDILDTTEVHLAECACNKEIAIDRFSAVKYVAHMMAGMAKAVGG